MYFTRLFRGAALGHKQWTSGTSGERPITGNETGESDTADSVSLSDIDPNARMWAQVERLTENFEDGQSTAIRSGTGYGTGYGYGNGTGFGDGYGNGYGTGFGDGYGNGYGW